MSEVGHAAEALVVGDAVGCLQEVRGHALAMVSANKSVVATRRSWWMLNKSDLQFICHKSVKVGTPEKNFKIKSTL